MFFKFGTQSKCNQKEECILTPFIPNEANLHSEKISGFWLVSFLCMLFGVLKAIAR